MRRRNKGRNKYDSTDSAVILANQPCPNCPSSDAYMLYSDGHGFCFSCQTYTKPEDDPEKSVKEEHCCSDPFLVINHYEGGVRYYCFHCNNYSTYNED